MILFLKTSVRVEASNALKTRKLRIIDNQIQGSSVNGQETRAGLEEQSVGQENTSKSISSIRSRTSATETRRSGTRRQSRSQATHQCSLLHNSTSLFFSISFKTMNEGTKRRQYLNSHSILWLITSQQSCRRCKEEKKKNIK